MAEESEREQPPAKKDMDEPVAIPLDPEEALRGLLKVDPDSKAARPCEGNDPLRPED